MSDGASYTCLCDENYNTVAVNKTLKPNEIECQPSLVFLQLVFSFFAKLVVSAKYGFLASKILVKTTQVVSTRKTTVRELTLLFIPDLIFSVLFFEIF